MQKLTKLFLTISTFFLISCATNTIVKDCKPLVSNEKICSNIYFSNTEIDFVYKANITVYGNQMSGIFIVKKTNETTHRAVFTTEFGNKLFDFEITENDFKVNFIVDELNKKILINTLKTDFKLLLKNQYIISEQFENESNTIYKCQDINRINYLFFDKKSNNLLKIVRSTKNKQKFSISFTTENNIFANHIVIQHDNIKLKIELIYLKQQSN